MNIGRFKTLAGVYKEVPPQRDPATGVLLPGTGGLQRVGGIWGNFMSPSGKEVLSSGGVWDSTEASLRVRYRAAVEVSDQLAIGGKLYSIKSIVPHENDRRYKDLLIQTLGEPEP